MVKPELSEIKNGWAARGDGWTVRGATPEEALQRYREAEELRAVVRAQPFFYEQDEGRNEANVNATQGSSVMTYI
jgi:hypothetical protein